MSKGTEFADLLKLKTAENPKKFHKMCELKLGADKGAVISKNYELMLQASMNNKPFPMEQFYALVYSEPKISTTLYSLLDGEYTAKVFDYLERNKEYLGSSILVDGDTSGFVPAFLGYLLPEAKITCMSWCPPYLSAMPKLFKKLGIGNVTLVPGRIDQAEGTFDSIVLSRAFLQNMVDADLRRHAFDPLPKYCAVIGERFKPYFACLKTKVKEDGHIFAFEQDYGKPICGALMQFAENGFDTFDIEKLDFHTPYGNYEGSCLHVKGGSESTPSDAYVIWKNFYIESNPLNGNMLEGTIADIALEDYHRELIGGYYFLSENEECGKIAMYRDALQYDKFIFYHSVIGKTALFIYDEKLIPEASAKIEDYVSRYKDQFRCVKIRQEGNEDCDPFEEENND